MPVDDREVLHQRYARVRETTRELCAPLEVEDYVVQSMEDASPVRWHLAHTTWFFETFVLEPHLPGFRPYNPQFRDLFNSYYEAIGPPFPRARRGVLSRPTVEEVFSYRSGVDSAVHELVEIADDASLATLRPLLELGLRHEQQHQELILTDLAHAFAQNPLRPALRLASPAAASRGPGGFVDVPGGLVRIGHEGPGFAFDVERPAHLVYLEPYRLARDLVNNAQYMEFVRDGGYRRPALWLADGWRNVCEEGWRAPLYWVPEESAETTLGGLRPLDPEAPVCHVSHFEADAFARWAGKRLPTEAEWEHAARLFDWHGARGTLLDDGDLHPVGRATPPTDGPRHMQGEVWEWTASAFLPYPGFRPLPGAVGEYNGKFASGQMVLRGGSCATPAEAARLTDRNYFAPHKRWQFSGLRLAEAAR